MKQKGHSPELISRPLVTTASQENDEAKIQNKIETAKFVYMGRTTMQKPHWNAPKG